MRTVSNDVLAATSSDSKQSNFAFVAASLYISKRRREKHVDKVYPTSDVIFTQDTAPVGKNSRQLRLAAAKSSNCV